MRTVTDSRVDRTYTMFLDALTVLMQKKSFSAITISELLEEAQLSRSTFYKHFRDKMDFVDKITDFVLVDFKKERPESYNNLTPEEGVYRRVEIVYLSVMKYAEFFRAAMGDNGFPLARRKLFDQCVNILREIYLYNQTDAENVRRYVTLEEQMEMEIFLQYTISAQIGAVEYWLKTGMKYSYTYMIQSTHQYVTALATTPIGRKVSNLPQH